MAQWKRSRTYFSDLIQPHGPAAAACLFKDGWRMISCAAPQTRCQTLLHPFSLTGKEWTGRATGLQPPPLDVLIKNNSICFCFISIGLFFFLPHRETSLHCRCSVSQGAPASDCCCWWQSQWHFVFPFERGTGSVTLKWANGDEGRHWRFNSNAFNLTRCC